MKIRLLTLFLLLFLSYSAKAQITLECVKPGQELVLKPTDDTLWVMNDVRMRNVIETGRKYKLEKEISNTLRQKCDTLEKISMEKDSLISILKEDKEYYSTELSSCRDNVNQVGKVAKKYQRRSKFASWGCVGCGILGLALGILLF